MSSINVSLAEEKADKLRGEILEGKYGASGVGRIPPTTSLTKEWATTRSTVYAALQILQAEGYLYQKGKSLLVNYPLLGLEGLTKNFEKYLEGTNPKSRIEIVNLIEPTIERMPAEIARIFGQEAGVHVVHRMRSQGFTGRPLRIAENWYPEALAGEFLDEMKKNDKMDVIGAIHKKYGLAIVESEDVLTARLPTPFEAENLHLIRTAFVVEIRRTNYAPDRSVLMWNKLVHSAAYFHFSYKYPVTHWSN